MADPNQDDASGWDQLYSENLSPRLRDQESYNFLEISKLPKKIDCRSLTSLIVSASKIVPSSLSICLKNNEGYEEQVAIVEFTSEPDVVKATDRIRSSVYGRSWSLKIIKDPKFSRPDDEISRYMK